MLVSPTTSNTGELKEFFEGFFADPRSLPALEDVLLLCCGVFLTPLGRIAGALKRLESVFFPKGPL